MRIHAYASRARALLFTARDPGQLLLYLLLVRRGAPRSVPYPDFANAQPRLQMCGFSEVVQALQVA
jgi:hypothetical protein